MLHIFAQVYFIFSQCTYHVLKHCVVLWLNTNTKKNLLERMQTGFVIRSHMGRKASTDTPAFIFFALWSPKTKKCQNQFEIHYYGIAPFLLRYDSLSSKVVFILWQPMPNNFSSINYDWMFPFYLGPWRPHSKYMGPSQEKYLNPWNPSIAIIVMYPVLPCLLVKWLSKMNHVFFFPSLVFISFQVFFLLGPEKWRRQKSDWRSHCSWHILVPCAIFFPVWKVLAQDPL